MQFLFSHTPTQSFWKGRGMGKGELFTKSSPFPIIINNTLQIKISFHFLFEGATAHDKYDNDVEYRRKEADKRYDSLGMDTE